MKQEEYKKNEEYINSTILPKLQEIQRNLLETPSKLSIDVSARNDGDVYVSSFVCVRNDNGNIIDSCSARFLCVYSKEEMDEKYNEFVEFIKKYTA